MPVGCVRDAPRCNDLPRSAHLLVGIAQYIELFRSLETPLNLRVLGSIPRRLISHSIKHLRRMRFAREKESAGCVQIPNLRVVISNDAKALPAKHIPPSSDTSFTLAIAVVRERERVIVPAVFALPDSVAGTTKGRTRTGTDTVFRHRPPLIEREQALK